MVKHRMRPSFGRGAALWLGLVALLHLAGCQSGERETPERSTPPPGGSPTGAPAALSLHPEDDSGLVDRLHPLGWSPDGKLAYVKHPADEASGIERMHLIVQDMVRDSILVDIERRWERDTSFEATWQAHRAQFDSALAAHGIERAPLALGRFPLIRGEHRSLIVDARARTEIGTDHYFEVPAIVRATVEVVQAELGLEPRRKTVSSKSFQYAPLALTVAGYLESPHEPRLAIVVSTVERGWEGPPHVRGFYLVGSTYGQAF